MGIYVRYLLGLLNLIPTGECCKLYCPSSYCHLQLEAEPPVFSGLLVSGRREVWLLPKGGEAKEITWLAGQRTCQPVPQTTAPEQGQQGRPRDYGQVQSGGKSMVTMQV